MTDQDLREEIKLRDEIKELKRQIGLRDAALAECHKEIFKLRDALTFNGMTHSYNG